MTQTPTAREQFAAALAAAGFAEHDAWNADLVRAIPEGFLILCRDEDDYDGWSVARFWHYASNPKNSDYDGVPLFEDFSRDRAAEFFMAYRGEAA